jgi:two-component system chemotaxis response regulator CheY
MNILIVEDNDLMRAIIRETVSEFADVVAECGDGSEAFSFFKKHRPDWVLMDWEMPQINGITAIRQIIGEFPEANICLVTAFDDEEIRREALSAGASGFVLKDNLFELEDVFAKGGN